jgi:very-short-patch-repair endonuclease
VRASVLTFKRARSLRRAMTKPEVMLWQALRGSRLEGLRFRRQHPVGPYILDFFAASAQLAVEIDGEMHGDPVQAGHDARRDAWLRGQGIRVLRVTARDVLNEKGLENVLLTIMDAAAPSTAFGGPPPPFHGGGQ